MSWMFRHTNSQNCIKSGEQDRCWKHCRRKTDLRECFTNIHKIKKAFVHMLSSMLSLRLDSVLPLHNRDFSSDELHDPKMSHSVYILPALLRPPDTGVQTSRWKESISETAHAGWKTVLTLVRSAIITHWCCLAPQGSLDNISIILLCFPGAPQLSAEALHQEAELEDLLEAKVAGSLGWRWNDELLLLWLCSEWHNQLKKMVVMY